MANYKSYLGVDKVYYALVTQDDSAGYVAGTPAILAPAMMISQEPASNAKTQYADNGPFDALVSEGETKISCEITGLDTQLLATLLGRVYDAGSARAFDNMATPPYIALGFRAQKSDGTYKYYWFLKGRFAPPKQEATSKSDSPDPKTTTLEYTAVKTVKTWTLDSGATIDGVKSVTGETSDASFSATNWWNSVITPVYGAPSALTCTPSPADGAVGQATSVVPTLTFNNELMTSTKGILMTKNDGVIVSATITINTALKVVTITPGGALASATKYLITVAGATDRFGQVLANTVYDFTTT
jgi:phi13 family phage major tail protein